MPNSFVTYIPITTCTNAVCRNGDDADRHRHSDTGLQANHCRETAFWPPAYLSLLYSLTLSGKSATMAVGMSIIEEAFDGQDVFLTGATGMLGTALLLKITKDTGIRRIYVLVRGGEGDRPAYPYIRPR